MPAADDAPRVPGIEDVLTLKTIGGVQISPDGKWVVYGVTDTDFEQDAFVTQLWAVPASGGTPVQLTRGPKSSGGVQWSPDSRWIGFTSARIGDKNQIFAIRPDGGEAVQLTKSETAVNGFEWSADGARIAYLAADAESKERKARKDRMGDFEVVRGEYVFTHIWTFDVAEALKAPVTGTQRTKGNTFNVGSLAWAPDGTKLAFHATRNADLVQGHTADVYTLDLATDTVTPLVTQAGPDTGPRWSPDGSKIAFESAMSRPDYYHANGRIAVVAASGGTPVSVTDAFDEDPNLIDWTGVGILFSGLHKTTSHLFVADPSSKAITRISQPDALIGFAFSVSKDGSSIAFGAASPTTMAEVYAASRTGFSPRKLTDMTSQLASYRVGRREVVQWKSQDGTAIEGVLVRPADFDSTKKYPLLVIIHGGPTGIDRPVLLENRYYPVDTWVGRGAMVLEGELSRQRGIRREVPAAQRPESRRRRRMGRRRGHRPPRGQGLGRSGACRLHGLEPGRLHLGVPDDVDHQVHGGVGGRRHLELGDLLLQHRHHAVHDSVPRERSRGRSGDLREDLADDAHPAGKDPDADSARRERPPRADPQRVRATAGTGRPRRAGVDGRLQGFWPRHQQAEGHAGRDAAQPRVVQSLPVEGPGAGLRESRVARSPGACGPAIRWAYCVTERRPALHCALMRSVLLVLLAVVAAQPAGRVLVLEHARLVDGTGQPPVEDARIVIEGERISAVGAAASVPVPAGAERVDLSGRTVLPGLVDMHFHLENKPPDPKLALRQLANGVTAFRDPGQWDEYFAGLRAMIAADGLRGPRIHTAGPHIDGERPAYPNDSVVARDAQEARRFAERAIAQGATAIKIYFRLPLGSAKAVIDVCREHHVISTAHLEQLEAGELFAYGLNGVEHITSLGPSLLPQLERERYRQAVLADNAARSAGRYAAFADLDLDSADARALWAVIGKQKPFIDATLAVFERRPGVPIRAQGHAGADRDPRQRLQKDAGHDPPRLRGGRADRRGRAFDGAVCGARRGPVARNGAAGRRRPDADAGHPGRHGHRRGVSWTRRRSGHDRTRQTRRSHRADGQSAAADLGNPHRSACPGRRRLGGCRKVSEGLKGIASSQRQRYASSDPSNESVLNRVGRYEITEKLGQGGMGTVYKAFDPLLTRVVAVKVISGQLDVNPDHRERFFREARAAAQLSHRNIITIYDLGEQDGAPYLAMEYLEGRDLDQRLHDGEGMSLTRKLELALSICEGLAHAHACGLIHRDIKPANVFVTDDGGVKILDFGLARLITSELTRSNVMVGTVNYMAPEQLRGERADHRADIFSFGVLLYELLGGRKPFQGDSAAATMYKILHEVPKALDELDPAVGPALTTLVDRAMAKAREDRYQRMTDLLRDLEAAYEPMRGADRRVISRVEAALRPPSEFAIDPASGDLQPRQLSDDLRRDGAAHQPTAPYPGTGRRRRVQPPARSKPRRAWLVGALALVLLAVAGWLVVVRRTPPPPSRPRLSGREAPSPVTTAPPQAPSQPTVPTPPPAPPAPAARNSPLQHRHRGSAGRAAGAAIAVRPNRHATLRPRSIARMPPPRLVQMDAGKAAAQAANAQELAPQLYAAAEREETRAREDLRQQRFAVAAARMESTATLFRSAAAAADAETAGGATPAHAPPRRAGVVPNRPRARHRRRTASRDGTRHFHSRLRVRRRPRHRLRPGAGSANRAGSRGGDVAPLHLRARAARRHGAQGSVARAEPLATGRRRSRLRQRAVDQRRAGEPPHRRQRRDRDRDRGAPLQSAHARRPAVAKRHLHHADAAAGGQRVAD